MTRRTALYALAVLNALLLVGLSWQIGGENVAHAQRAGRSDYLMIPGRLSANTNGVMYFVDTRNGVLGSFMYDSNRRELFAMDPIDLNQLFAAGPGIGGGNRQPPRRP